MLFASISRRTSSVFFLVGSRIVWGNNGFSKAGFGPCHGHLEFILQPYPKTNQYPTRRRLQNRLSVHHTCGVPHKFGRGSKPPNPVPCEHQNRWYMFTRPKMEVQVMTHHLVLGVLGSVVGVNFRCRNSWGLGRKGGGGGGGREPK